MNAYCIKVSARKAMSQRAEMLHSTIDFDCPYEDIVEEKNHWVMEQRLHWAETFSGVVFQDYKDAKGRLSPSCMTQRF